MDKAPSVLVIGGASWDALINMDSLPEGKPETIFSLAFHECAGSTGVGKALNLARLGFTAALHSPVGDDAYGRMVAAELASGGVEFLSETDSKGTGRHTNIIDKRGRRISIYCAYPSFEPLIDQAALEARFASTDIIVLNIINYCRRLIPAAKKAMADRALGRATAESPGLSGDSATPARMHPTDWSPTRGGGRAESMAPAEPEAMAEGSAKSGRVIAKDWSPTRAGLWVDIHDWDGENPYHKDFVDAASVLFMSSDQMPAWRAFMEAQVAMGKALVVCTHGAKGASALWADGTFLECPIVEDYGYRDSNGAGDAFFSGFLAAAVHGLGKEACLRMASLAGALCVASERLANPKMDWAFMLSEYRRIWASAPL